MSPLSLSLSAIVPAALTRRGFGCRTDARRDGGCVVMTGCGPQLGVLLLLAVLLQTVVVTITVLHFTAALNSVSLKLCFLLLAPPTGSLARSLARAARLSVQRGGSLSLSWRTSTATSSLCAKTVCFRLVFYACGSFFPRRKKTNKPKTKETVA